MKKKALIIGCGITGSVIARYLAENCDYEITIWERRNHIGGNLYDYTDPYGIRIQQYGPHIFHTNKEAIYDYICKYASWEPFQLICGAVIDNICTPTAFNFKTIDLFYTESEAATIKQHIRDRFGDRESATVVELLDCGDDVIQRYAQFLFDKDYSLYTAKQWGVSPATIDKSVLSRVPIRFSYDEAYFKDKYQVMPQEGYTGFIKNILNHKNIAIKLSIDALEHVEVKNGSMLYVDGVKVDYPVIYTGPLDELFGFRKGRLPYRSLRFEWRHEERDSFQEFPVIAYPQAEEFTRITEYKKLPIQNVSGTTYAVEFPIPYVADTDNQIEPYYPVLTDESRALYFEYRHMADEVENLYCCGRLADFKYYDMDQVLENALLFCNQNFERECK